MEIKGSYLARVLPFFIEGSIVLLPMVPILAFISGNRYAFLFQFLYYGKKQWKIIVRLVGLY
ncbi:hypothetical protein J8L85_15835 [Maribacter sp. MMG018]|uniref:hypothetical protein n=1 Tax=Maribacter sp. MMG018 TaxID=2822688 RepID=UPI001B38FF6A|nr:hypothetical protein [Maribacter sp. MMG018]MBQ4915926.1 hypothetical protein [Maribacter sp. MMG018]